MWLSCCAVVMVTRVPWLTEKASSLLSISACLLPRLISLVPVTKHLGSSDNVPGLAEDRLIAVRDRSRINDRVSVGRL